MPAAAEAFQLWPKEIFHNSLKENALNTPTSEEALLAAAMETTEEYAIVEVFGHRKHAGRIYEIERFGTKLLRIDIPKDGDYAAGFTTHFYGGPSIFSMTPCDLATVQRANKPYQTASLLTHSEDEEDGEQNF